MNVLKIALFLLLTSCTTYQSKVYKAVNSIEQNNPQSAAAALKPLALTPSDDQLVYLLDYATALQLSGNFQESNKAFLQAEHLSDVKDYTSLSREAGSLLLNEGMVQYKGDAYELVLINAMLAINFLMLNDLDAALVETRKLNDKLYKYRYDGKRNYEMSEFGYYLAAMIWEQDRKYDDAYIDYEKAYKLNPQIKYIGEDLIRTAFLSRRYDKLKKWRKEFPQVKYSRKDAGSRDGELVVIFQQGWGPRKRIRPENHRYPMLSPKHSRTQWAKVQTEGRSEVSGLVYDVENASIQTLDDDYSRLIAKRVGGVVAKAVVSDQVRQKNQALGDLAWIIMNVADRADLRQWSTLPASFQVARMRLKPGKYTIQLTGLSHRSGGPTGEQKVFVDVEIHPKKKTFLNWRSVN